MAEEWWKARSGGKAPPPTVDEALQQVRALKRPADVEVENGEFARITPLNLYKPSDGDGRGTRR